MNNRYILILVLAAFFSILLFSKDDLDDKIKARKQKLEEIQSRIKLNENKLNEFRQKESSQKEKIKEIEEQLSLIEEYISTLNEQETNLLRQISLIQENIRDLNKKIEAAKDELAERLVYEYKSGNNKYLKIILSTDSLVEFSEIIKYSDILDKEEKVFFDTIMSEKAELENEEKKLNENHNDLLKLKSERQDKKQDLEKLKKRKEYMVRTLKSQQSIYKQEIAKLNMLTENLNKSIKDMEKKRKDILEKVKANVGEIKFTNLDSEKGNIMWPVKSPEIYQNYGNITDKTFNTKTFNGGLDIKTKGSDKNIYAVADGIVIYKGILRGIGNVVMIDHGNEMMTLYAYLKDISTEEGNIIKEGDVIGNIKADAFIHFEIRKNQKTLNPLDWLRGN